MDEGDVVATKNDYSALVEECARILALLNSVLDTFPISHPLQNLFVWLKLAAESIVETSKIQDFILDADVLSKLREWTKSMDSIVPVESESLEYSEKLLQILKQFYSIANTSTALNKSQSVKLWKEAVINEGYIGDEETEPKLQLSVADSVSHFFAGLHPIFLDIVKDFAGTEMFLIDGEALLFEFLLEPTLDRQRGQFLHLVYLVETFLKALTERGAQYEVVFFKNYRQLWKPFPRSLLARESLISHLQGTTVAVWEIDNWANSDAWSKFLQEHEPTFILTGMRNTTEKIIHDDFFFLTKTLILHSLTSRLPVALFTHIEFKDSKVMASTLQGSTWRPLRILLPDAIKLSQEKFSAIAQKEDPAETKEVTGAVQELASDPIIKRGGWRLAVAVAALRKLKDCSTEQRFLYLLHEVLLQCLPLTARAQMLGQTQTAGDDLFFDHIFQETAKIIEVVRGISDWSTLLEDNLCDIADGRLFLKMQSMAVDPSSLGLPKETEETLLHCWKLISASTAFPKLAVPKSAGEPTPEPAVESSTVIALKSQVLEEFMSTEDLPKEITWNEAVKKGLVERGTNLLHLQPFNWNTAEDFGGKQPKKRITDKRELKAVQKYARFVHHYAESLEGSKGLHNQIIAITKEDEKKKKQDEKKKKLMDQKMKNMSEPERIAFMARQKELDDRKKEIEEKKGTKSIAKVEVRNKKLEVNQKDKDAKKVDNLIDAANKETNPVAQLEFLERETKKFHQESMIKLDSKKLEVIMKLWRDDAKSGSKDQEKNMGNAVKAYRLAIDMYIAYKGKCLGKPHLMSILNVLLDLGFKDTAQKILDDYNSTATKATKADLPVNVNPSNQKPVPRDPSIAVGMSSTIFQLKHAGHLMQRDTQQASDPRVKFQPDKWQRDLLDIVDKNESALVVAPTSSGKTFISFYTMEKALKEGDEGIVVYVAPTKALVNQTAAEVYARFSSKAYKGGGKTLWGVHTRDQSENTTNCQVLITVPEILEMYLLSPVNNKPGGWVDKIRFIVFDEVHCIGETDSGDIWEHLLLLARCPFVALSATVGNPSSFHSWLQKIQEMRGHHVHLVQYNNRWCDLEKYVFFPSYGKDTPQHKIAMHPCTAITADVLRKTGFPVDLTFVPKESHQLYLMMQSYAARVPEEYRKQLDQLNPELFFAKDLAIVRSRSKEYEKRIKDQLCEWAKNQPTVADELFAELGAPINESFKKMEKEWPLDPYSHEFLIRNLYPLLRDLEKDDKLPAILFNFQRKLCTKMALQLMGVLLQLEDRKRSSPEYKKKMEAEEKKKEAKLKLAKKARDAKDKEKDKGEKNEEPDVVEDTTFFRDSIYDQMELECTFLNVKTRAPAEELQGIIRSLNWRYPPSKYPEMELLIQGLARGIGVHHTGMPKKYRESVETLFRKKHLRIIFSTETLALGINMPCRTSIFAGDSCHLNNTQFRQMSGRAGRRGFDNIGYVIFFGFQQHKINRLLSSEVPLLTGHFPLTSSLILRLMMLYHQAEDKQKVKEQVLGLFSQPLFCVGKEQLSGQMKHHIRYSLEYLMREGMVNSSGQPLGFAGLVSDLFYTEPSNFALATLFKSGAFTALCKSNKSLPEKCREVMVILCHLFMKQYVRPGLKREDIKKEFKGQVFLGALPESISASVRQFNSRTMNIFTEYLTHYAQFRHLTEDQALPLSHHKVLSKQDSNSPSGSLLNTLEQKAIPFKARSAFSAISGHGDHFHSAYELSHSVHPSIFIDSSTVPVVDGVDWRGQTRELNAYILDFYTHGMQKPLTTENGIPDGDVWFLLKDFSVTLSTITKALTQMSDELNKLGKGAVETAEKALQVEEKVPTKAAAPVELDSWEDAEDAAESWEDIGEETKEEAKKEEPVEKEEHHGLKTMADIEEQKSDLKEVLAVFELLRQEFAEKMEAIAL